MSLLCFCDIVILVYDGGFMKKKNVLLYLFTLCLISIPSIVNAYGKVSQGEIQAKEKSIVFVLIYLSPFIVLIVISLIVYLNREHERAKENVEDRNLTGAHGALDVRNVKDREFMEYIEETEDKTDLYLSEYFNNITDLKYIKERSSEALYNNIVDFLNHNKEEGKYLIVKDTVVQHNEIKSKRNNIFSTDIIIECFNYMEDLRGNYLCGYKVKKEFVRKRVQYAMYKDRIYLISIEDM